MEDRASSAFARIASALAPRKSRKCAQYDRGLAEWPRSDEVEIQIRNKPNELHTIRPKIARGGRHDGYAFLCLNQREDRLHRIRLVLNLRRKTFRLAGSNNCVENNRCSLSMKEYESFISKIGKPNLFDLPF